MAGPVWRVVSSGPFVCSECLREVERGYAEGRVTGATFEPERRLCSSCYSEHVELLTKDA